MLRAWSPRCAVTDARRPSCCRPGSRGTRGTSFSLDGRTVTPCARLPGALTHAMAGMSRNVVDGTHETGHDGGRDEAARSEDPSHRLVDPRGLPRVRLVRADPGRPPQMQCRESTVSSPLVGVHQPSRGGVVKWYGPGFQTQSRAFDSSRPCQRVELDEVLAGDRVRQPFETLNRTRQRAPSRCLHGAGGAPLLPVAVCKPRV